MPLSGMTTASVTGDMWAGLSIDYSFEKTEHDIFIAAFVLNIIT